MTTATIQEKSTVEAPLSMLEPRHPDRFGPYVVLGQLGRGGMGVVYRALDSRLGREVAVKVLHRNLHVSAARERFLREARAVSSLNHPNICTIFDIGEQDGDPFLVMELLPGESLRERIRRGPVPAADIREIAFRVALALQAAHAQGIVHRDIKPANLFLVDDGQGATDIKVLDFGLAKLEGDDLIAAEDAGLTRTGATVGTVEYMSPEQACGEELDARSDLFSLGAVLYELAAGRLPFRGATSAIVFSELLNRNPPPPREANLDLPQDLDWIIRGLLVKDRARRIASASMLLDALHGENVLPQLAQSPQDRTGSAAERDAARKGSRMEVGPQRRAEFSSADSIPSNAASSRTAAAAAKGGSSEVHPENREAHRSFESAGESSAASRTVERRHKEQAHSPDRAEADGPAPAFGSRSRRGSRAGSSSSARAALTSVQAAPEVGTPDFSKVREQNSTLHRSFWPMLTAVASLLVLATVGLLFFRHTVTAVPRFEGVLQMMPFVNGTGDPALDRFTTVSAQILLSESTNWTVRHVAPADILDGGSEASERQVRAGALPGADARSGESLAIASGMLSRTGSEFRLQMRVVDAATHAELASETETAASAETLPAATVRVVTRIRNHLGDGSEQSSDLNMSTAITQEVSASIPALANYGEADARAETGDLPAAVGALNRALALDTHFALARMRLAELLLKIHAQREARAAAEALRTGPAMGGPHLQARREYLLARLDTQGSAALRFANAWRSSRPRDVEAQQAAARELLTAGRTGDAVQAAEAAISLDPYRRESASLLTRAQIESGHPDAAWSTQTRAYALGIGSAGLSLAAASLRDDASGVQAALLNLRSSPDLIARRDEAIYLANAGERAAASVAYTQAIESAAQTPAFASAANLMRAEHALDLALAGECAEARAAEEGAGEKDSASNEAILATLARAWCGTAKSALTSVAAGEPNRLLSAAEHWRAGDLHGALAALGGEAPRANSPLAHLVRGRLHALLGEREAAIADYEAVVSARGSAYLSGVISYPAALAGLAEAYGAAGDHAHAEGSFAALRKVWTDPGAREQLARAARVP